MDNRYLFATGARLLGLYFLVDGLASAPGIAFAYTMGEALQPEMGKAFLLANAGQAIINVLAGITLLIAQRVSGASATVSRSAALDVGLRLLGVYFLISGVSGSVTRSARAFLAPDFDAARLWPAAGGMVAALAGVALWLAAGMLSRQEPPNNSFKPKPLRGSA